MDLERAGGKSETKERDRAEGKSETKERDLFLSSLFLSLPLPHSLVREGERRGRKGERRRCQGMVGRTERREVQRD
jgi:hypothetical protein